MTNERASATATGLPALLGHIREQQRYAVELESLMDALLLLNENEIGKSAQFGIISLAYRMARELNEALDSTTLPDVLAS
jgi:hypothetical protein